jgi:type VI secretion system protein ImpE
VKTGPGFKGVELGEVLVPVLSAFSWKSSDDAVRLGRATEWNERENGDVIPAGQKMLLVDGEEIPFLELRNLEIAAAQTAP